MVVPSLRSLPIGYRFLPTDEEVINYYLHSKMNGEENDDLKAICEVDICKFEPWDLPHLSAIKTCYDEWFFFCPLDRKYSKGNRQNRATEAGYWKPTGKDRKIKSGSRLIGMKRSLVFYTGRVGHKTHRTNWVMHEYRTTREELDGTKPEQNVYVICHLFKKQDKKIKGRKGDEAGPSGSSSAKDMQHELEVPQNSHTAEEEVPPSNETRPVLLQNEVIDDIVPPILECNNNNNCEPYGVTNQMTEAALAKDDNTISQLDLQIEPGLAPSMFYNVGNTSSGMEFEHNTDEDDFLNIDIMDFDLNSTLEQLGTETANKQDVNISSTGASYNVLNSNGESSNHVADGGSCNESYVEAAQVQNCTLEQLEIQATAKECAIPIHWQQDVSFSGTDVFHSVQNSYGQLSHHANQTFNSHAEMNKDNVPLYNSNYRPYGLTARLIHLLKVRPLRPWPLLGPVNGNMGDPLAINATAQECTIPTCNQDANFSGSEAFYIELNSNGNLRNNHVNSSCDADTSTTGIVIRSRPARSQPDIEKSLTQDINVPQRLRLQVLNDSACACGNMEAACTCEVVPSRGLKKFSAHCSLNPFAVMFVVAVMLILFIVFVSKMHAM
ncbi:hypothetical protein DITRI_Ditri09bG0151100 [Diplodiscus trichospermus]